MVKNIALDRLNLDEASKVRQQAAQLLARLDEARIASERRSVESGKRDPMKFITGRTALESAIASVRDMVGQMDRILESSPDVDGGVVLTRPAKLSNTSPNRSKLKRAPVVAIAP